MQSTRFNFATWRRLPLGVMVLALAAGCGGDSDKPAPKPAPPKPAPVTEIALAEGDRIAKQIVGTWRDLDEDTYLHFTGNGVQTYLHTASHCYPAGAPLPVAGLQGMTASGQFIGADEKVQVFAGPGTLPTMTVQRVPELPAKCLAPTPADPATTAQVICELFDAKYPFFRERSVDWAARCADLKAAAAGARNADELQPALIRALEGFSDDHVSLTGPNGDLLMSASGAPTGKMLHEAFAAQSQVANFDEFYGAWIDRMQEAAGARLAERHEALNGAVVWGRLPGNIGYLSISRMAAYADNGASAATEMRLAGEEIDRVITALADTRAMVIDVAVNQGGLDLVSGVWASRFADARRLAFVTETQRPDGKHLREWHVQPGGARQYTKPVYLLTSDQTVSAGETFVLMMRALPHVRQAGQKTAGSLSDAMSKPLPGGFTVTLSFQVNRDAAGVLYEAVGIPPHVPVLLFDPATPRSLEHGQAAALDALLAQIGR